MDWAVINDQASQQHVPHDLLAREDMQRAILAHPSRSGFFDAAVFQGGTALRLVYGNTRFSEDLDFVARSSVSTFVRQVSLSLATLAEAVTGSVGYLDNVRVNTQKLDGRFRRDAFRATVSPLHKTLRINLEFMGVPSHEPHVTTVAHGDVTHPVVAESLREIFADKVVALALRPYVKGRDLWDLDFLLTHHHVSPLPQLTRLKVADYGVSWQEFSTRFSERLAVLPTVGAEALASDMPRFVTADAAQHLEAEIPVLVQRIANRLPQAVAEVPGPRPGLSR